MDLGIAGRRAIVAASSSGLGLACATSLAQEGVHVVLNGRNEERLLAAADLLRNATGVEVKTVVGDIALDETRVALLAACSEPDIVITNNSGPNPGKFTTWSSEDWHAAIDLNMLAPLLLIRDVIDGMVERKFGRIVNITSAMVKTPMSPMGLSSAARTGLISAVKGISREVVSSNVTINNLLPERINTGRQQQMAKLTADFKKISVEEAYDEMAQSIAAKRIGRPEEVGDMCAYLCSVQASYISGQSIQLDGGSYAGIF